jgi:putative transposase
VRQRRWTEEQILEVLKAAAVPGARIRETCRSFGVSLSCFYRWRGKFEGLELSQGRQVKELEAENLRLKQLLATRDLELDAVQRLLRKNSLRHSNGGQP